MVNPLNKVTRKNKLISLYKPYKGLFATDMLCAFASAAISVALPVGVGYITGDVLESGLPDAWVRIVMTGGIMLLLVAIQTACSIFMDNKGHAMGAMMERDIREELFAHFQKLSFSYYDVHSIGEIMSRITNDSLLLTEFFHHTPEDIVVNAVLFIGAAAVLFSINVPLTLVILAFIPFMALYTLRYNKKMAKALLDNKINAAEVNARVEDSLSGIRTTQSFGNEELENKKFAARNNLFMKSRQRGYKSEAYCYGGANVFTQVVPIAVIVVGGLLILNGSLTLAELIVFRLYASYFTSPIEKLIHMTNQLQEGRTGFSRFMEIMETEPEIQDAPGAKSLNKAEGEVEFRDVGFSYSDGTAVLSNISFNAKKGEYVAFVGPSGVGKTTLCSLIPRFYDVSSGDILIDGHPIKDVTIRSLRENIGVVSQSVYLFSGTVRENILYGRPGAGEEAVIDAAIKAGAHEFILRLPKGYDTDIGPHGVRLSGGQQQRLSIARVFLKDPPILIFDEATGSLDNQAERVVQASLEALSVNRTTFVIAHRLSTIRNAGRIMVLTDDGIAEEGTHDQLMALKGEYEKLYNLGSSM